MPNFANLTNMQIFYIAITVAVVSVITYYIIRGGAKPRKAHKTAVFGDDIEIWPYQPLPLMTASEVVFFKRLEQAVPELYIFSQVQLSRLIEAQETGEDAPRHNAIWRSRIAQMSVDYVLVDSDLQTPLLVIELDDWSHDALDRQVADAKKNKALNCAGLPILRFHGEDMPDAQLLRQQIVHALTG